MNQIWNFTINQYLEIVELAEKNGKKPGDSMMEEMQIIVDKYNLNPIGNTELTIDELKNEYKSKGQNAVTLDDLKEKKDE